MNVKSTIAWLLTPAARLAVSLQLLERVWAHALLAARIDCALDSSVLVLGAPEVHGTRRIQLGRNLFLYRGLHLETQRSGFIEIGDNVVVSRGVHIVSHAGITIGANSMIGEYASIRDANHRFGDDSPRRSAGYKTGPIRIGQNVWIGRGAAVLRGVTIGDHAVVGANAVVTRDIPAGTVVVAPSAQPLPAAAVR